MTESATQRAEASSNEATRRVDPYLAAQAGLLVAALLAYRSLIAYSPGEGPSGAESFLFEPAHSSPGLIFTLTLWMLWNRRHTLRGFLGRTPAWLAVAPLGLGAIALHLWAHYVDAPDLAIASLSAMLIAGGALVAGRDGIRTLLLPALLLLLAIPLPPPFVNLVVYPLQLATADFSGWILVTIFQMPSAVFGDLILTEERVFQVIETCAGMRGMVTLTMAALVYGELFQRLGWRAVALAVSAPIVGLIVNNLRVLTVVLNPYSEVAEVHTAQGLVMIAVGVLGIAAVDAALEPIARRYPPPLPKHPNRKLSPLPVGRLATVAGVLVALAAAATWLPRWEPERFPQPGAAVVPHVIAGLKSEYVDTVDLNFLGTVGFSEVFHRRYLHEEGGIELFVGVDHRLRRDRSLISEKTAIPTRGWRTLAKAPIDIEGQARATQELLIATFPDRIELVLHWFEGVGPAWSEVGRNALALDRGPWRRDGLSRVVRISTPIDATNASRAAGEARLLAFAAELRGLLDKKRPPAIASHDVQGSPLDLPIQVVARN